MTKKIHYFAGITIALFVGIHLLNHVLLLFGEETHLAFMKNARLVYRNIVVESLLLLAVFIQVISGIRLAKRSWKTKVGTYQKLHIYSGLYLSFFLIAHTTAVLAGRLLLQLDTNLYFGASGLSMMPFRLFFLPYYSLAIISFFTHIACVHQVKVRQFKTSAAQANTQAQFIIGFGAILAAIIIGKMLEVEIPDEFLAPYR